MLSALQFVLIGPRTILSKIASTSSLADACQKTINICCCEVQRESDPPGQYPRLKQQGHHEALTQLGGTYGEVGCMIEDMLIGVLNCLTVRTSRFQSPLASCSCLAISASGVILGNKKIYRQLRSASQSSRQPGEVGVGQQHLSVVTTLSCCSLTPKPHPAETRAGAGHFNACSRAECNAPARKPYSGNHDTTRQGQTKGIGEVGRCPASQDRHGKPFRSHAERPQHQQTNTPNTTDWLHRAARKPTRRSPQNQPPH